MNRSIASALTLPVAILSLALAAGCHRATTEPGSTTGTSPSGSDNTSATTPAPGQTGGSQTDSSTMGSPSTGATTGATTTTPSSMGTGGNAAAPAASAASGQF